MRGARGTTWAKSIGVIVTLATVLAIASCSSSESAATACTPGQQSSCACPGGTTGIQTCNQDGMGLGPCLSCGGAVATGNDAGGGGADAALPEATASYCAEHCDDSRCQTLVACVGEVPVGWTGPTALSLTPGTLPPCDATFGTKLFEGGDTPTANPTTCGTIPCIQNADPNGGPPTCVSGTPTAATIPPPRWTNKALGCRANPPPNGNCGAGKVCSPRPSTVFSQSLCIANLTGDVPCPSGTYSERHVIGQTINDTRVCAAPTCAIGCQFTAGPPTGSLTAASLVTVCCAP